MNQMNRRSILSAGAAFGLGLAAPGFALAQEKPVPNARVTVGFPPGDMSDGIARLIAENLRGKYAEVVLVDNKPGAAARMAITSFVKNKHDGSEVLFTPGAMVVLFPHVFEKLAYDPMKELVPVTRAVTSAFVLAVGPGVPAEVKTLDQYLAWTKKDPKNAVYATSGAGTGIHLTAEYLFKLTNTPMSMAPYKGASPAANDLIAGQVPAQMASIPSIIEFQRSGKARFLAITSDVRMKDFPDVPTLKELGYPQLVTDDFFAFFLPSGASAASMQSLNASVLTAMKDVRVVNQLERMGLIINPTTSPAEFKSFVDGEYKKWGAIAKQINFNPLA